jgi:hypothetical protein
LFPLSHLPRLLSCHPFLPASLASFAFLVSLASLACLSLTASATYTTSIASITSPPVPFSPLLFRSSSPYILPRPRLSIRALVELSTFVALAAHASLTFLV